ncbi:hypothetical protein LJQ72_09200 [Pectobacterium brasiliense]|uniref:hypothetical protein n=1 Tax=Pectobacterium brasiliense TaxID=180957 RepID=UPI001D0D72F8|nr:hypothetical protein [Pectobacterium brasiliense]UDQ77705.1 hypothetical protein LJQ72_09200 [Pectobacterium brasiliense]
MSKTTTYSIKQARPNDGEVEALWKLYRAAQRVENRWCLNTAPPIAEELANTQLSKQEKMFLLRAWQILVDGSGGFSRFMGAFDTYVYNFQDAGDDCIALKPSLREVWSDGELLPVVLEAYEEARQSVPHHNGMMQLSQELAEAKRHIATLEQQLSNASQKAQNFEEVAHGLNFENDTLKQQLAAERATKELLNIGNNIRAQDNRATDQPMFVVFEKQEIIGSDEHSPSRIVWCRDGEEVSESRAKRLEALHQECRATDGYERYAMQEIDVFVTACFTEQGCKDFLRQDGHNHRLPYIYACGSFRNHEYQAVRNFLAGLPVKGE